MPSYAFNEKDFEYKKGKKKAGEKKETTQITKSIYLPSHLAINAVGL